MRLRRIGTTALALGVSLLVILGIGSAATYVALRPVPGGAQTITSTVTWNGSTLLYPLASTWAPPYAHLHPSTLVTVTGTNSGTGIKDAQAGLVSIGASDAYLSPAVKGLLGIPLTVAGVGVVYNLPPQYANLRLSGSVLASMFAGRITHWNDPQIAALNPGRTLPSIPVIPVHRSDSSGSTFVFTSYLAAQSPTGWPVPGKTLVWPTLRAAHGSDGVVATCAHAQGCITYAGVSYATQVRNTYHMHFASLQNGSGRFALPTASAIATALRQFTGQQQLLVNARQGYPIINYEYAIVKAHQPTAGSAAAIRQFLHWALTSGSAPRYLSGVRFVALPQAERAIALHLLSGVQG